MKLLRRCLSIAMLAMLAACASTSSKPTATPQTAALTRTKIEVVHGALRIDAERVLGLRVAFPREGRRLPVVVFSHGAYSSGDDYDPILDAWARRGFVVISVTHRDSVRLGVKRGTNEPRYFAWRLDDMEALLARLPEALQSVPQGAAVARRVDLTRIAAAGHSFGGLVAQTLGGATYFDATSKDTRTRRDLRVRAVLILSGAGPFPPTLREADFATLKVPTFVSVGTNDLAQAPGLTGEQWRRLPFDLAAPGDKFRLTLRGADHYFGGSVGRDDLPRSERAGDFLQIYARLSGDFLDAYLRNDARAAARLASQAGAAGAGRDVDPLATLERR